MKVEIFSDVACPWCYIGHTRFDKAAERFRAKGGTIEVTMRPFQLDPNATAEGQPLIPMMERKFGPQAKQMVERVKGVGAEEGLDLRFEDAMSVSTFEAHRLISVATKQGRGEEMADRLFRAYFTEGRNVADAAVLAELAAEVGVTDTGEGADEVREQLARAHALGISGVPLFLFEGKYAVSGAQPEDAFAAAIDEVAERVGETPITQLAAPADGCADGACAI
ncbi:DsbA family oxidoreductase [Nonomuraea fastidiosa]|jgi:predicted DsbA family dithiol-disulfide isomerase|uniref:DsbA family oxidoreductase n=1 Tax=Nonomuraea TaxID=83681 RepID=UPI00341F63DA